MNKSIRKDVVEWDVTNWSRAIDFFETASFLPKDLTGKKVLDIGGRNGGLSLYWALRGATVVCSDVEDNGFEKARMLHKKYNLNNISYRQIDATTMDFNREFDIVTFKSVLGGVGFNDHYENQVMMMDNIYKALKPGGAVFFVENMKASNLHQWMRKKIRPWGGSWRYVDINEIDDLMKNFKNVKSEYFGYFGLFGRGILSPVTGLIDRCVDRFAGKKNRYIVSCYGIK